MSALMLGSIAAGGCGEASDDASAVDTDGTEVTRAPLLGAPGAFYTTAPAWAFCGSTSLVDCHGGYSFNSRGGPPTFLKRAVGLYRVFFENQPSNGNVQVAASASNAHCGVAAQFPSGTGVGLDIACRAPISGAPVDSQFMVSYYRDTNVGGPLGGYANVSAVAPFTVSNAWNSSGGGIAVQSMGLGRYRVTFSGQQVGGDNAQVTALTSGPAYCTLGANGWLGGAVDVTCFNSQGQAASVPFSVSYGHNVRGEPRNALPAGTQGALVAVNAPGGVDPNRSRNSCQVGGNSAVLQQQPSLTYVETYHAVTTTLGEVPLMSLVSAMSGSGAYCNLSHFPIQGVRSDSTGFVKCFGTSGNEAGAPHSSMFIIQDRSGC